MNNVGFVIGSAALTFTVTNVDVFCLLVLFFAKAKVEEGSTNTNVWIAQAIGFSIIVGVSLLGLAVSASVETQYVSLLGVIPILMGAKSMYHDWDWVYIKHVFCCAPKDIKASAEIAEVSAVADIEVGSESEECRSPTTALSCDLTAIDVSSTTADSGLEDLEDNFTVNNDEPESKLKLLLKRFFPAQLVEMTFITVANGGDNIAIYLPIFAACSTHELVITVVVYYALLVVWLVAAYALLGDRRVIGVLHRYGHYVVPICLIGTGVYILSGSVLFSMI